MEQAELTAKYSGYFTKQASLAAKLRGAEETAIATTLDYGLVTGLRNEARLRLSEVQPVTIGQAGRIQGVTPADLSIIMVANKKALATAKAA